LVWEALQDVTYCLVGMGSPAGCDLLFSWYGKPVTYCLVGMGSPAGCDLLFSWYGKPCRM
jgi:hypothetical protein